MATSIDFRVYYICNVMEVDFNYLFEIPLSSFNGAGGLVEIFRDLGEINSSSSRGLSSNSPAALESPSSGTERFGDVVHMSKLPEAGLGSNHSSATSMFLVHRLIK